MQNPITKDLFHESIEQYYNVLKNAYEAQVAESKYVEYAKQYFQRILFTENEMVPYWSVISNELRYTYNHFNSLNSDICFEKTLSQISQIRRIGGNKLIELRKYSTGDR